MVQLIYHQLEAHLFSIIKGNCNMVKHTSRVTIKATAANVWATLTEPELVKQWQCGSELFTDWRVGSEIHFRSQWQGQIYEQWGKVEEVIPNQRIRYSLFAPQPGLKDRPEHYFVMTYKLDEHDGATTVTIDMDDNRPGASDSKSADADGQAVLALLKATAESL